MLSGCRNETGAPISEADGLPPYKTWEEMLRALERSPDHLAGRADALVAAGDPAPMLAFVRDEIYLMPARMDRTGNLNQLRWGVREVLRSGFATPREKAELLHHMFQKAGIPSKIMKERTDFTPEEVQSFYLRRLMREFAPEVPEETLERWASELGYTEEVKMPEDISNGIPEASADLGGRLLEVLDIPDTYNYYHKFKFDWDNFNTPVVSFENEGKTGYAHLFDPSVPFGAARTDNPNSIQEAGAALANEEKVRIRVSYRDAIAPGEEKELIKGEWLATELVGRQVNIQFLNNLTLEEQAITPVGEIRTFTPAMALQALDADQGYMEARSVLGTPITLEGMRMHTEADAGTRVGDAMLLKGDPDLARQVQTLEVQARSSGYPNVKLEVWPRDAEGRLVEGLGPAAFRIREGEKPVRALMESNQRTPRILIMVDTSGSMPEAYSGENMQQFVRELKESLLASYPAAILTYWETNSNLYSWLQKGAKTNNDLMVYATDGHVYDNYNEANQATYWNGPPALILDVRNSTHPKEIATFKHLASITEGTYFPVANRMAAQGYIKEQVDAMEISPYVFSYRSLSEASEQEVTVKVDEGRLTESAVYKVLRPGDTSLGPVLIGLYLELEYDGVREKIHRVLAGWDPELEKEATPSEAMVDAVQDFMFARIQLSFEGVGPTLAAGLSDALRARLSTRKWGEALLQDNLELAREAFAEGYMDLPASHMALMAPLSQIAGPQGLTLPHGLRIGMHTEVPGLITGDNQVRFDYLPTSRYFTIGPNPKDAFERTLRKTAELGLREGRIFESTTFSELENTGLTSLQKAQEDGWFDALDRDTGQYLYWRKRVAYGSPFKVFDNTAGNRAFWDVNRNTGEVYGILPDRSGGGKNDEHVKQLGKTFDMLSAVLAIVEHATSMVRGGGVVGGIGMTSIGIVAKYGVTLTKLYAIATEAIIIMDTSGMDDKIKKALQEFACEVAKQIVFGGTGNVGAIVGGLDQLIGMIMEESPTSCSR